MGLVDYFLFLSDLHFLIEVEIYPTKTTAERAMQNPSRIYRNIDGLYILALIGSGILIFIVR